MAKRNMPEVLKLSGRTANGDDIFEIAIPESERAEKGMSVRIFVERDRDGKHKILTDSDIRTRLRDWWLACMTECVITGLEKYRKLTKEKWCYGSRKRLMAAIWDDEWETWVDLTTNELTFHIDDGQSFDEAVMELLNGVEDWCALRETDVEFAVKWQDTLYYMERLRWVKRKAKGELKCEKGN